MEGSKLYLAQDYKLFCQVAKGTFATALVFLLSSNKQQKKH